jgi:hypothetical protein
MSLPTKQNICIYIYIFIIIINQILSNTMNKILHIIIIPCHLDEIVS